MNNQKTLDQLKKLVDSTKAKKIPWKNINDRLIRWIKNEEGRTFTVTLQSTIKSVREGGKLSFKRAYIFTIQATNPNENIIQIDTTEEPALEELVKSLFSEALGFCKESSLDVVDQLLKDL